MKSAKPWMSKYSGVPLPGRIPANVGPRRKILPPFMLPTVAVCYLLFGLGDNALLALVAIVVLLLGCALLWRPGETPILPFIFVYQWLQASLGLFYANWRGLNIDQLFIFGGNTQLAVVLCLAGLFSLAAGMRLGAGRSFSGEVELARRTAQEQPQSRFILLYVAALVIATVAQSFALVLPGLSQPLVALADFKWAAFFILTFATFVRRDSSRILWCAAFLIELAMSFGGYYSSFKFVFLFTLTALVAAHIRLTVRKTLVLAFFGTVLITFGLVWTAVKVEYRSFVSGGQVSQAVVVDYSQSVEKIIDLVSTLDDKKMDKAATDLIERITYVDYFAAVLTYVPSIVPHEDGALWLDAIIRPFMPRLFFPEKEIIDDSTLTNKYIGFHVAGMEQATTITIGYMGESYIDFGMFGMMVPIFALGLLLGLIYRWLMLHRNSHGIFGMGLSTAVIMETASDLGNSAAIMFGAIIVSVLVAWLLISYAAPNVFPAMRK